MFSSVNSGAYLGSQFFATPSSERPQQRANPSLYQSPDHENVTPSSGSISLHQKLDMLLSGSTQQQSAIEQLRKENLELREDLETMAKEIQVLKEAKTSGTASSGSKIRLPSSISVSSATHASTTFILCSVLL